MKLNIFIKLLTPVIVVAVFLCSCTPDDDMMSIPEEDPMDSEMVICSLPAYTPEVNYLPVRTVVSGTAVLSEVDRSYYYDEQVRVTRIENTAGNERLFFYSDDNNRVPDSILYFQDGSLVTFVAYKFTADCKVEAELYYNVVQGEKLLFTQTYFSYDGEVVSESKDLFGYGSTDTTSLTYHYSNENLDSIIRTRDESVLQRYLYQYNSTPVTPYIVPLSMNYTSIGSLSRTNSPFQVSSIESYDESLPNNVIRAESYVYELDSLGRPFLISRESGGVNMELFY